MATTRAAKDGDGALRVSRGRIHCGEIPRRTRAEFALRPPVVRITRRSSGPAAGLKNLCAFTPPLGVV
jgi:hypothetical protein